MLFAPIVGGPCSAGSILAEGTDPDPRDPATVTAPDGGEPPAWSYPSSPLTESGEYRHDHEAQDDAFAAVLDRAHDCRRVAREVTWTADDQLSEIRRLHHQVQPSTDSTMQVQVTETISPGAVSGLASEAGLGDHSI